ncbi:MAG TPA: two-component regulator propeller domain-containing protein, partial [Arenimonas sp.]|nr:two-component regulator propeller domain-containing protein [Arenimonas sp.]
MTSSSPACADCPAVWLDEPRFDSIGDSVSIPEGVVSSLAEDQQGFLWIGTAGGLVRYDGHRFRLHGSRRGDPNSLSAGFIRALLVARDGRLWVGTESDGLAVYDPSLDRFEVFRSESDVEQAAGNRLSAGSVRALAETADGHIWVGIIGGGLDELDPRSGEIRHHRPGAPGGLNDDRVQSLLVDRDQTLWVGTWDGLRRRRAGSDRFEPVVVGTDVATSLGGEIINQLFQAADGQIWVGTQAGDLLRIDPASGVGHAVARADSETGARRSSVYALTQPNASQLWVGRASGIEVRDAGDGRLLRALRHDPARPNGLAGNEVRALLRDRAGLIWAGGY